jgi:hypothetical protein
VIKTCDIMGKTVDGVSKTREIVSKTCGGVSKTSSDVNEYEWVILVAV